MEHKDHCCCANCGETFENQIERQRHEKLHQTQGVVVAPTRGENSPLGSERTAPRKNREFTRSHKE